MIDLNGEEVVIEQEEEFKVKRLSLFDWLGDLNYEKKGLYNESTDRDFSAFMINRGMSQHVDTILIANEMNKHWHVSKEMVHDFYLYIVPKKKRYGKWSKQDNENKETIDLIINHYKVSHKKATEYLKLLNQEDIDKLKKQYEVGGKAK